MAAASRWPGAIGEFDLTARLVGLGGWSSIAVPCCAFAAFIVGQILIGFDAIKRRFFWTSTIADADNPATLWRLNAAAPMLEASPRRFNPRWIAAVALIELALIAAGAYGVRTHLGHSAHHDHAVVVQVR